MAYGDATGTITIGSDGTGHLDIRSSGRQTWIVSQVSVALPGAPASATCRLTKNGAVVVPVLVPQGDTASGDPPIQLRRNETMRVEYSGCTAGTIASVYYVYDDGT